MNIPLLVGAAIAVSLAVAHSLLGERYILVRLLRRPNLPHLFGSDAFTKQTLRFAWHLTSIAWLGFAAILCILAIGDAPDQAAGIIAVIGATYLMSAVIAALATKGRHLAWLAFLAIAVAAWIAIQ